MSETLLLLPDTRDRERISDDLDSNLLVEAGAGAGKTTEMIKRMLALVARGNAEVSQIAAVTFTRKAAAELRERFQNDLERAIARETNADVSARLDRALRHIDSGFIGTIHAFCARMLREHPIEAGLDPDFHEVVEVEELILRRQGWARACERLAHQDAKELRDLVTVGLKPAQLESLYSTLCDYVDVDFPSDIVERPDPEAVRDRVERLLEEMTRLLPQKKPRDGWDDLQRRLRSLNFKREVSSWNDESNFFDALEKFLAMSRAKPAWIKWGEAKEDIRDLFERLKQFAGDGGDGDRLIKQWWAYRYPYAIAFARKAAAYYAEDRLRTGKLNFQDLLMFTAKLLRENAGARRALSKKFRYLLVDEFQDTDPLQAEILFALATENDVLRPGALFLVGDPKQSIYRFRRADISIYNHVKARFAGGEGEVLRLTTNFRSTKPLETFVNDVFEDLLPREATEQQAAFTPMITTKAGKPKHGAWCVGFGVASRQHAVIAQADAERIATWIAKRVRSGKRKPGDFLLLTNRKAHLQVYARALEAREVPVEVTGASVGMEEELHELVILLEALSDPSNPTLTVAALLGLFFGIDYDQLLSHRMAGGKFNFIEEQALPETAVLRALRKLRAWWLLTRREPADVALPKMVEEIGLLPHAAGGDLGATRAGALLFALDAVRAAGLNGDTSLRAAIEAIRVATEAAEAEAPLEPGRADVVRVMNVHKAKGLEAPIVILAFPTGEWLGSPTLHVERDGEGARGFARVEERAEAFSMRTLAQPLNWPELSRIETEYERAEDVRLLYVAATRAAEELIVSRCYESEDKSPWRKLYPHFDEEHKHELDFTRPPRRQKLELEAAELGRRVAAVETIRNQASEPTYTASSVKDIARKHVVGGEVLDIPAIPTRADVAPRGIEWGTIVHSALEVAARGNNAERIQSACRGLLLEYERPLDALTGEPAELDELLALVAGITASDVYKRAMRAGNALVEVPLAAPDVTDEAHGVIDGVIDLAFKEKDGWVIVDYKTDAVADPEVWQQRTQSYKRQVDLYADIWERLTGEQVVERVLYLTSVRHEVKWRKSGPAQITQMELF